ncbi:MAG TPA: ATP-binding cassette domain-containing protein [Planctomycetota bacterium]|nr:ATP-binding cassette domain-containing protein [Planctomycetota bacterium]
MVIVEGLVKVFREGRPGEVRAVDGVSFSAKPGEVFGLLGPNGAGKTTALRMLSTILRPTAGRVEVAGVDAIRQPDEVRRRLGFLSGATGVYDRLTPREQARYYGALHGLSGPDLDRRVAETLKVLRAEDFADRPCGTLSSGQKQKASLARTVVHDPPVLVLDEPTANLDVLVARSVVDFIRNAKAAGRTVLLSTHDMSEADRLCDRLVVIHRGRVLAQGTPAEVKAAAGGAADLEDAFFRLVGTEEAA